MQRRLRPPELLPRREWCLRRSCRDLGAGAAIVSTDLPVAPEADAADVTQSPSRSGTAPA